jgi:hypothetical protein
METWNKSDIGKILVYKNENGFDKEYEIIAIYDIDSRVPNIVGFMEYPISLDSKIGHIGLVKGDEKINRHYLKKHGDWFYVDNATKEERWVLERIALTEKVPLDED